MLTSSQAMQDLSQDYYQIQEIEQKCTEVLSETRLGERKNQITTFIPSLILEYEAFWKTSAKRRRERQQ